MPVTYTYIIRLKFSPPMLDLHIFVLLDSNGFYIITCIMFTNKTSMLTNVRRLINQELIESTNCLFTLHYIQILPNLPKTLSQVHCKSNTWHMADL